MPTHIDENIDDDSVYLVCRFSANLFQKHTHGHTQKCFTSYLGTFNLVELTHEINYPLSPQVRDSFQGNVSFQVGRAIPSRQPSQTVSCILVCRD